MKAAEAMSTKYGVHFSVYKCAWCDWWHVGKTEDFKRLNAEQINGLLQPLGERLKDFREKVEQVYSYEAKERYSLSERIKDLVELNNRLSEEANNLTRALKGDSKMQGNWGEVILERLLQASGLIEGEHYRTQEFLKDEHGELLTNEESGRKMQPDVIIRSFAALAQQIHLFLHSVHYVHKCSTHL